MGDWTTDIIQRNTEIDFRWQGSDYFYGSWHIKWVLMNSKRNIEYNYAGVTINNIPSYMVTFFPNIYSLPGFTPNSNCNLSKHSHSTTIQTYREANTWPLDRICSAVFTFASLPVWPQQKSLWTETEHAPNVCEARVGTSSVAERTVTGIFAIQFILRESSAWQILTGA